MNVNDIINTATAFVSGKCTMVSLFGLRAYSFKNEILTLSYYRGKDISLEVDNFDNIKPTLEKVISANSLLRAVALMPNAKLV